MAIVNKEISNSDSAFLRSLRRHIVVTIATVLWAGILLWLVFPPPPMWVERYYSRSVYRAFSSIVVPLTASFPFSIVLVLLFLLPLTFLCTWVLVWWYRKHRRGVSHKRNLLWGLKYGYLGAAILGLWFLVLWGAGYQRAPMAQRLELPAQTIQPEEAQILEDYLLDVITSTASAERRVDSAIDAVATTMVQMIADWDTAPAYIPKRVKATPKGFLLAFATSGICSPFTLEAHVDGGLPDATFVAVAAHELAHIAGICSEAEANCVSYAAGLHADDAFARYSVALYLYKSLIRQRPEAQRKAAWARLPKIAHDDLQAAADARKRYEYPKLSHVGWRLYHRYLQSQGIESGVQDYAYGATLFVQLWRTEKLSFLPPSPYAP